MSGDVRWNSVPSCPVALSCADDEVMSSRSVKYRLIPFRPVALFGEVKFRTVTFRRIVLLCGELYCHVALSSLVA